MNARMETSRSLALRVGGALLLSGLCAPAFSPAARAQTYTTTNPDGTVTQTRVAPNAPVAGQFSAAQAIEATRQRLTEQDRYIDAQRLREQRAQNRATVVVPNNSYYYGTPYGNPYGGYYGGVPYGAPYGGYYGYAPYGNTGYTVNLPQPPLGGSSSITIIDSPPLPPYGGYYGNPYGGYYGGYQAPPVVTYPYPYGYGYGSSNSTYGGITIGNGSFSASIGGSRTQSQSSRTIIVNGRQAYGR